MKMYKQLGHYVEAACDGDMAKFNTSGFVAAATTRTAPQPLPPATFEYIDRGPKAGDIVVKVKPIITRSPACNISMSFRASLIRP